MPLKLDPEERYIVAYYRSRHVESQWCTWLFVRLLMAGLFVYGCFSADQAILFTAFGTLLLLDLYSQFMQPRYRRTTRSALEKLERRIEELEQQLPATN
jgi:hypothetical protein